MILNRPDEDKYERLRDQIKSQDGHACVICHKTSSDSELHVHHIIPLSLFGTNQPQNLVTLCYSCHNKQHSAFKVARKKLNNSDNRIPRKSTFIAVDIKTTGFFNEDEIIEIGAALFENGSLIKKFQSLLHTRRHIPDKFTEITGITQQMVDSAPKLDIVFPQFMSFIGKSNLVVHNADFVMPFLQKYAKTFGTIISNNITDTLSISRKKLPQLQGDKLFTLTNYLKTKRTPSNRALDDSIAIGLVFLRLASIKDEAPTHQTIKNPSKRAKPINKPNEGFVPTIKSLGKNIEPVNKPPSIIGNETLEDAFKLDRQQNYTTSFQIYRHLARQGEVIAQFNLGVMYANGQGIVQNDKHAVYCYQKAGEQGYASAQNNLGWMYQNGRGVRQDNDEAVFWYRKAAEQGNETAQCNLGLMYENGRGVVQDDGQAVFWYRKAAEQGDDRERSQINYINLKRKRLAADQSHARAQYKLGEMYLHGNGLAQADEQAVSWYRKAAEQGHEDAQCELGLMYSCGFGVEEDYEQAAFWYRMAADQGHARAQCDLGEMYEIGSGVEQDEKEAVFWYCKAANQGYARGMLAPIEN